MPITIEDLRKSGSIEIHAKGKLHKPDYDKFVPVLEKLIQEQGKARVLFIMHNFHGWDASALWEDIKFDTKHFNHFDRLAFVGDKTWEKWMAKFCKPFTTGTIRYFSSEQEDEARSWLLTDD